MARHDAEGAGHGCLQQVTDSTDHLFDLVMVVTCSLLKVSSACPETIIVGVLHTQVSK